MGKEESIMRKNRVLIIDCDINTCKEIKYSLQNETTEAYYTTTVAKGLAELTRKDYELVILNLAFPETDGMRVLQTIRDMKPMPILLLSTSAALDDKVTALRAGADDYVVKPFVLEEFLARCEAMMRRYTMFSVHKTQSFTVVECGDLVIGLETRQVFLNGRPVNLTRREFDILRLLALSPGQIFTFEQLYEQCWQQDYIGGQNSVMCQMKRLRQKLNGQDCIETIRGIGYRFRVM